MISVIVTTYNQEKTIARTLDSILRQRCHLPVEIIIGEDCSTDHTREICQEYAARYPQIRLFCNDHNKGIVDNYFDCLLVCQGDYIADCAGDDFWIDDQKLEKASRLMEADSSITLVHTGWHYYDETTKQESASPSQPFPAPLTDGKKMLEAILTQTRMPVIHLCTALYRAETIRREYEKNTDLFREGACEDLPITFHMALAGKIAYMPDITLCYSQGPETISASKDERKLFAFYRNVTMQSFSLSSKYNIESDITKDFFQRRVIALLMHAFRANDPQLFHEAVACQKLWAVKTTYGIRTIRLVLQCPLLWRLMLRLRQYLR